MKKLFVVFLAVSALSLLALPVMAVTGVDPSKTTEVIPTGKELPSGPTSGTQLIDLVDIITNWVFAIFVVLTVIFVLLAAFQFVTAGGDAAKVGEARQKLVWASVGVIIALASKGLVPVIRNIVGG